MACTSCEARTGFVGAAALLIGLMAGGAWGAEGPRRIEFTGQPGLYSVAQWKADWPGCSFEDGVSEGRVSLHGDGRARWLRVTCRAGEIGPDGGGAGWRWPFDRQEAIELTYALRFDPDFDFVKGGKLPGLGGGPENVTGGHRATGENGFSVRPMWRKDGRGEAYVYHRDQPQRTGESFPFPADFRFPPGEEVRLRISVTMNQPGERNGSVRMWATLPRQAERLMVERTEVCWRTVETFGADSLYFQTFHGGSERDWAPRRDCWVEFSDFEVRLPSAPAR